MAAARAPRQYGWKDPRPLSRFVAATLWLQILVRLFGLVFFFLPPGTLSRIVGSPIPRDIFSYYVQWVGFVLVLAGVVAAGFWTFRIGSNARWLRPDLRTSPWGAVLWYLVPGANLVLPYLAMRAFWRTSQMGKSRGGWLVAVWWITLLYSVVWTYVMDAFIRRTTALAEAGTAAPGYWTIAGPWLAYNAVQLASLVLYLVLVGRLTKMQVKSHPHRLSQVFSDAAPATP